MLVSKNQFLLQQHFLIFTNMSIPLIHQKYANLHEIRQINKPKAKLITNYINQPFKKINILPPPKIMRPSTKQRSSSNNPHQFCPTYNPHKSASLSTSHFSPIQQEDSFSEMQMDQNQAIKNETFYECTQSQEKIWTLFKSLDCYSCQKMYNNKQRKPQIICANNHLLCKSCYSKQRQVSLSCPFCSIRMNTKSTSSHQSIQLFLKIYNQIFEKQKCMIEEKRKRSFLEFEIPKNLKTLTLLLLIIVTPWIYDGLKMIVCWVIEMEERLVIFLLDQVTELGHLLKMILEDEFFVGLYTNERGDYVYHGDDVITKVFEGEEVKGNSSFAGAVEDIFTNRHKAKIEMYLRMIYFVGYLWNRVTRLFTVIYELLRLLTYCLHFLILVAGLVQFPFLIPLILFRLQILFPRKYRYRIALYLDILQEENSDEYIEPEEIEKLTKGELYCLLFVRNYIQAVLELYKTIEVDMKRRCEELEYKKRLRLAKKGQQQQLKETSTGNINKSVTKRFTF